METHDLDIAANRAARKWSRAELATRLLWETLRGPLFRCTPRQFWSWRVIMLRMFGAEIGKNVRIHPTVRIAIPWNLKIDDNACLGDGVIAYNLGVLSIGKDATVSQYVHLCGGSHDYTVADMPLLKSPITLGPRTWVCADAFIGPGVTVRDSAVVGARAVVVGDVPAAMVVAGNPARVIGPRKRRDEKGAEQGSAE